ncbi:MAG: hypothetical protein M3Y87_21030 [Myxococcota bacterium]|nr:hypothetical protein [Myxococcota bacterium]
MSNHDNHRRAETKRTETGPAWESADPGAGCNSTHVARARRGWKRVSARTERRTGATSPKYAGSARVRPALEGDDS